ncbi:hypothetical protein BGZ47_003198, partial [Haplosporangium gracile]
YSGHIPSIFLRFAQLLPAVLIPKILRLVLAIVTNSNVAFLDLRSNFIGPNGAQALSEALKTNSTLTSLNLNNSIEDNGAVALSEALKTNSTLTELSLMHNWIGENGAQVLSGALKTNSTLIALNLERNSFGDDGAQALAEVLKTNLTVTVELPIAEATLSGLKELVLDHCWIKEKLSSWNWVWKSCSNVERLELRMCGYDNIHDMAAYIRTCLPNVNSLVYKGDMVNVVPASLLSACIGGWKNIRIDATLNRSSCKALAEHCAKLEILQVINILEDSSSTLRQILSSSPKFSILITSDDKLHVQSWVPYLEAKDFVDEYMLSGDLNPWACELTLRVLKTKIACVPRPDVTKLLDGRQRANGLKETCTQEGKQLQ